MNTLKYRIAAVSALLLVLLVTSWVKPRTGGETPVLVRGAWTASHCLTAGTLTSCGTTTREKREADVGRFDKGVLKSVVGPFALLQYLPTMALVGAGASAHQTYVALAALTTAALLAMLAVLWALAERVGRREWAPGLVLVCLASPLLFYANSSDAEILGAFVLVAFLAALVLGKSWWVVAGAAFVAGISKETAPPFLAALGLIAVLGLHMQGREFARRPAIAAAAGLLVALATNLLFNVFRYGTITNLDYTQSAYGQPRPPLAERPQLFAGLFFAPNGGLLPFWPLAALLLGAVAVLGVVALRRGWYRKAWPALALLALFLAFHVGLASWRGPFGWWAWGPRLTLPWVPVFVAVGVLLYGAELSRGVRALTRSTPRLVATACAITLLAAPQVGVLSTDSVAWELFLGPQAPVCRNIDTSRNQRYYDCMEHRAWEARPILFSAVKGLGTASGALTGLAFLAATAALLGAMRDRLGAPARTPRPARASASVGAAEPAR